jgi:hypothetical protein
LRERGRERYRADDHEVTIRAGGGQATLTRRPTRRLRLMSLRPLLVRMRPKKPLFRLRLILLSRWG